MVCLIVLRRFLKIRNRESWFLLPISEMRNRESEKWFLFDSYWPRFQFQFLQNARKLCQAIWNRDSSGNGIVSALVVHDCPTSQNLTDKCHPMTLLLTSKRTKMVCVCDKHITWVWSLFVQLMLPKSPRRSIEPFPSCLSLIRFLTFPLDFPGDGTERRSTDPLYIPL